MLFEDFDCSLDSWIKALDNYSLAQLCTKPSPNDWSMGQLYRHLIADTNFYIQQIRACIFTNDYQQEEASTFARAIFSANAFPDTAIEGSPLNAHIKQPQNKEQVVAELSRIKDEVRLLRPLFLKTTHTGKTKHPGLGYFTATEWLQFAEMHFRHHLRQKKRIDEFLQTNSIGSM